MKKDEATLQLKENYIFSVDKEKNSRAPLNNYSRQSSSNRGSVNNSQLINSINESNKKFIVPERGLDQLLNMSNNKMKKSASYSMKDSDDNESEKAKSKMNSSRKQQNIELSIKKIVNPESNEEKDAVKNPFIKKKTLKNNYEDDELKKQDSFKVDNRKLMKKEKIVGILIN